MVNFIRSDWIRPEDLHYYEEIGIDYLKIVDRTKFSDTISLATDAYTNRSYNGNLADLIPTYSKEPFAKKKKFFLGPDFILRPFAINVARESLKIKPGRIEVYIDNRKLDGFLEFFIQGKCKQACNECNYCSNVAKQVVKIDDGYREKTLNKLKIILENNMLSPI